MTGPALLWEDPHGLAVDKPAGMLTQGPIGGEPTLEAWVRRHLRPDDPASAYLGTVHRLDRPVSGVILWAKAPKAARRWSEQFASRRARKEYAAIVEGSVSHSGVWVDWLASPDREGRARVVDPGTIGAARAVTAFEVVADPSLPDGFTRLALRPETGRTHQLRAQAAARGWPIVGDSTYGATGRFPIGIALHARSLAMIHPARLTPMVVEAPLPASWEDWRAGFNPRR